MLLAFSEQTKGQKFPENAPDQEMLEIVMARWVFLFGLHVVASSNIWRLSLSFVFSAIKFGII